MSKEKQIDIITDLLIDFDEMGFIPTTTVPDPEAYAIEWRKKLTEALRDEFGKLTAENETLRICLKDQRGRNAEFQKANEELAKQCEEYKAELLQMPNIRAEVARKIFARVRKAFYDVSSVTHNKLTEAIRDDDQYQIDLVSGIDSVLRAVRGIIEEFAKEYTKGGAE